MTSNMGAEELTNAITNNGNLNDEDSLQRRIVSMLRHETSPEFVNRIDEIVLFKPLTKEVICKIVDLQIHQLEERLKKNEITLKVTPRTVFFLTELGYDPTMGARPVKRCINDRILNPLTQALLMRHITIKKPICVDVQEGEIVFSNEEISESI